MEIGVRAIGIACRMRHHAMLDVAPVLRYKVLRPILRTRRGRRVSRAAPPHRRAARFCTKEARGRGPAAGAGWRWSRS